MTVEELIEELELCAPHAEVAVDLANMAPQVTNMGFKFWVDGVRKEGALVYIQQELN